MCIRDRSRSAPLTLDDAYAVQRAGIERRVARGDTVVGLKLGFTSRAKAEQMGVSDVIAGVLTASMQLRDGARVDPTGLIHPRVEPEIAFRFGTSVDPTAAACDPVGAIVEVAPALEIIDSRYENFRFSLADVVADNTSAAAFVVGSWRPLPAVRASLDLTDLAVTLSADGAVLSLIHI